MIIIMSSADNNLINTTYVPYYNGLKTIKVHV